MFNTYLLSFIPMLLLACGTWLVSLWKHDASIVDSVWSVFFLVAAAYFTLALPSIGPRAGVLWVLLALWAIRLCAHITWRNWGHPEDSRYQTIRQNNEPNFAWKSLYLVFILQALLAWIIAAPLLLVLDNPMPLQWSDYLGIALAGFGWGFESLADWQLAQFKAKQENAGKVMDSGLWRYTRHPNYFGEFCVWWGFFLLAVASGVWAALLSPLVMSFLLLNVSGVPMLEKDIVKRRPAYQAYAARTNAFFPGLPKP
jgi:steroid 5-alpha reductase family enzyme